MTGNVQSVAVGIIMNMHAVYRRLCVVSKRANSAPAVNFQKLLFELAWSKSCKKHHAFNWYTCNYVSMSCRITFYTECYMYSTRDCLAKHRDDEDELMSATDYHLPDSQDKNHVIATRDIEWGCTLKFYYRLRTASWLYLILQ